MHRCADIIQAHKPGLQTVLVPATAVVDALLPPSRLAVEIPGIGRGTAKKLNARGVACIGDVLGSPAAVAAAVGPAAAAAVADLCRGRSTAAVVRSTAPTTVSVEDSFWPNLLVDTAVAERVLQRLSKLLVVKVRQDERWFGHRQPANIAVAVVMHRARNAAAATATTTTTTTASNTTAAAGPSGSRRQSRQERSVIRHYPLKGLR
jgi:nucleotidyltransferase/DNA polymerase involved in DNA repair